MKRWTTIISTTGLAFVVSGYSSDYAMATEDGRMISTGGKPGISDDTGLVGYHDQQGSAMQTSRDGTPQIIER